MKDNIKTGSQAIAEQKTEQPRPFVLALMLTGILYFSVSPKLTNNNRAKLPNTFAPAASATVTNAVVQDLSIRLGLPATDLRVVQAKPQTWPDRCLGLSRSGTACIKASTPGWHIVVARGEQQWLYRTNASGTEIALESSPQTWPKSYNTVAIATHED